MSPITVVVLTHNEAANLPGCLDSLAGFDDVHVLDSGSTDGTRELAITRGVQVHLNAPFRGFGQQRNWAIDRIPVKYDWQFHLDADERLTPELIRELSEILAADRGYGGYRVASKLMFCGKWLKRAGQYPGYQVRFFHRDRLRFTDHGHGQREATTFPIGTLRHPIIHYGFSKGIDEWFRKHVGYARREAEQSRLNHSEKTSGSLLNGTTRRRWVKRLVSRLPGRYFLRLVHLLVLRGGVLDGWHGVTFARMLATYESMMEVYQSLLAHGIDPDRPDLFQTPASGETERLMHAVSNDRSVASPRDVE